MENYEYEDLTAQIPEMEPIPEEQLPVAEAEQEIAEEPAPASEAPAAQYRGAGRGRRESPYANSPYEMKEPARQQYTPGYTFQPQTQPMPKVKKEKKQRNRGFWKKALAAALVIALVAAGCGITAAVRIICELSF